MADCLLARWFAEMDGPRYWRGAGTHCIARTDAGPIRGAKVTGQRGQVPNVFVVNVSGNPVQVSLDLGAIEPAHQVGRSTVLSSANLSDENSFAEPNKVEPRDEAFAISANPLVKTFTANSLTVLRF